MDEYTKRFEADLKGLIFVSAGSLLMGALGGAECVSLRTPSFQETYNQMKPSVAYISDVNGDEVDDVVVANNNGDKFVLIGTAGKNVLFPLEDLASANVSSVRDAAKDLYQGKEKTENDK